jgi:hypothetical protein
VTLGDECSVTVPPLAILAVVLINPNPDAALRRADTQPRFPERRSSGRPRRVKRCLIESSWRREGSRSVVRLRQGRSFTCLPIFVWLSNEVSACRGLAVGVAHKRDVSVL